MVPINPPVAVLGRENAVLSGRGVRRYEHRFAGPLSVKGVIRGVATWETRAGRFDVIPGCVLLLNDGEEYEITVDTLQPVETFCLFFSRGFVEDAVHSATTASACLLECEPAPRLELVGKLHFDAPLVRELERAHARMRRGEDLDESFYAAATQLARAQDEVDARVARLPALRASTREELARRVGIATAFLHANLDRSVRIAEAAREACLSPFHFHRLFGAIHGTTPHRYLTRLRLEKAKALLRGGDRGVSDVAAECGFASAGSFATLFKRTFGTTPAAIRKNGEAPSGATR